MTPLQRIRYYTDNPEYQTKMYQLLARYQPIEREEISKLHQKYYACKLEDPDNILLDIKNGSPARYNLYTLIMAIEDYTHNALRRKRSKTSDEVDRSKTKRRIYKVQRQTYKDRIRALLTEIDMLRTKERLSWSEIAVYLQRAHRKYFAGKRLSASYLRRAYNDLI